MSWTAERVEYVKTKWAEGMTATDIALDLGGVSRNAVLGKVHRLRLDTQANTPRKPEVRGRGFRRSPIRSRKDELFPFLARNPSQRRLEELKKAAAPVGLSELPPNLSLHAVSLTDLDSMHCRWVLGEPSDLMFCGDDQKLGSSYCHRHHAMAYTKPERSGERRPFDFRKRAA